MPITLEAIIDEHGKIHLKEPVSLPSMRRALVIVLEEEPIVDVSETALLSEQSLGVDWNRPEEDEAWSHLQKAKSS